MSTAIAKHKKWILGPGMKYQGEVVDGLRHGVGTQFWSDGSAYSGNWYRNCRKGEGVHTFRDGSTFSGEWSFDLPCSGELRGKDGKILQITNFFTPDYPLNFLFCYEKLISIKEGENEYLRYAPISVIMFSTLELGGFVLRSSNKLGYIEELAHCRIRESLAAPECTEIKGYNHYFLDPDIRPHGELGGKFERFDPAELIQLYKEQHPKNTDAVLALNECRYGYWVDRNWFKFFDPFPYRELHITNSEIREKMKAWNGYPDIEHPEHGTIIFDSEYDGRIWAFEYHSKVLSEADQYFDNDEDEIYF